MLFEEYNAEKALEVRGKEEYEKGLITGKSEGEKIGFLKALVQLVKDGILTLAEAAKRANMTIEDFKIQTAGL